MLGDASATGSTGLGSVLIVSCVEFFEGEVVESLTIAGVVSETTEEGAVAGDGSRGEESGDGDADATGGRTLVVSAGAGVVSGASDLSVVVGLGAVEVVSGSWMLDALVSVVTGTGSIGIGSGVEVGGEIVVVSVWDGFELLVTVVVGVCTLLSLDGGVWATACGVFD